MPRDCIDLGLTSRAFTLDLERSCFQASLTPSGHGVCSRRRVQMIQSQQEHISRAIPKDDSFADTFRASMQMGFCNEKFP